MSAARYLDGKQRSSCINFEVDHRTDPALKTFVYTSRYKQRNPILFSRKVVYRFATRGWKMFGFVLSLLPKAVK